MKTVELMGIPGAGKTRFLNTVKKENGGKNIMSRQELIVAFMEDKYRYSFIFKSIFPNFLYKKATIKLYFLLRHDKKNQANFVCQYSELCNCFNRINYNRKIETEHKKRIHHWFLRTGEYYLLSTRIKSNSIFLNDEGFFQRVSSLFVSEFESEPDTELIARYVYLIPKIDEIIYIKRNFDNCLNSRINTRGYRLENLSEESIEVLLKMNEKVIQTTFDIIKAESIAGNIKIQCQCICD